jgi:hypothetical protein
MTNAVHDVLSSPDDEQDVERACSVREGESLDGIWRARRLTVDPNVSSSTDAVCLLQRSLV